jgi:hypothetical protein
MSRLRQAYCAGGSIVMSRGILVLFAASRFSSWFSGAQRSFAGSMLDYNKDRVLIDLLRARPVHLSADARVQLPAIVGTCTL